MPEVRFAAMVSECGDALVTEGDRGAWGSWRQRVPAAVGERRFLRTATSPSARTVAQTCDGWCQITDDPDLHHLASMPNEFCGYVPPMSGLLAR